MEEKENTTSPPPYINNNIDTIRKPLISVAFSVFCSKLYGD